MVPGLLVLVRTELLKLGTTRAPWLLAGGALALTVLLALQPVTRSGRDGAPSIGTVGAALGVLDALGRGALVALLVGVLVVTAEFRHQTVGTSLLQTPNRIQLVVAKSAASSLVGLALGMSSLILVLAIGAVSGALPLELVNSDIAVRVLGLVLTYPLYALIGAAVGALLNRTQPLAVILPIAWLLAVEGLVTSALPQDGDTLVDRGRHRRPATRRKPAVRPPRLVRRRRPAGLRPAPPRRRDLTSEPNRHHLRAARPCSSNDKRSGTDPSDAASGAPSWWRRCC